MSLTWQNLLAQSQRLVALTGAGISTLCGIPDYRGPQGLYRQDGDAAKMLTIDRFLEDPQAYYSKVKDWVYRFDEFTPGPVHQLLADWQQQGQLGPIVTQNVDMLHQQAGSHNVIELHGSPQRHFCLECEAEYDYETVKQQVHSQGSACCHCGGWLKPEIVFFGESLPLMTVAQARDAVRHADLLLVLGTSLQVQPACSLPLDTLQRHGRVLIVNNGATPLDDKAVACLDDLQHFVEEARQLR